MLRFMEDQHEEDNVLILATKEIRRRETELKITKDEWFAAWMLEKIKKRKIHFDHLIGTYLG